MNGRDVQTVRQLPARSLFGLNAANFFQAEMVGVILPVLNALLQGVEAGATMPSVWPLRRPDSGPCCSRAWPAG